MSNISSVDQDYYLWALLHQTSDAIFDARENELRQYGITTQQASVLSIVNTIGSEATPAEVSRRIFRKPHSVSGLVERAEKAGLLKKTKDLHKKNLVRVTITEKGQKIYNQSSKIKAIHRIMSALSEEERRQLQTSLEKLRSKAIKDLGMDPKKVPLPEVE